MSDRPAFVTDTATSSHCDFRHLPAPLRASVSSTVKGGSLVIGADSQGCPESGDEVVQEWVACSGGEIDGRYMEHFPSWTGPRGAALPAVMAGLAPQPLHSGLSLPLTLLPG